MNIHTRRWIHVLVTLWLMMALPACLRAYPGTDTLLTTTPTALSLPTQTGAVSTITSTPPSTANNTSKPTATLASRDAAFENVRFTLPANLASSVASRKAPEFDKLGELYPGYTEFTLLGYDSQNTDFKPQIQIYPVREMGASPTDIVQELKELLTDKPATLPRGIPILPIIPAGQLIDVQIQYLTFTNGSGIRVLTQLAQDSWPINNEGLVYIFQGVTSDDAYYISAFLPVAARFLPDHVDDPDLVPPVEGVSYPQFGSPDFNQEYLNYHNAITHKLNNTASEEFRPALGLLDDMLASMQVGSAASALPAVSLTSGGVVTVPCVNGLPTRLSAGGFAYVNPDPPLPNNLRSEAGKDNELMGEIQPGQAMKILDGPKCANGWVWWKVRTFETELTGWTAEGDQQNYWLVPCKSQRECNP